MTLDEMAAEITWLTKEFDEKFVPLAKMLREFRDTLLGEGKSDPLGLFEICCKSAGIGKRKAFYLIEIDKVFGPLDIPMQRLTAIGWTKLSLMAKHVDPQKIEDWLKLGESNTVEELKLFLAGKEQLPNKVHLRFNDKDYAVFSGTLLANGASLTPGGGISNKEQALIKIMQFQHRAWKAGYF